ncbi:MAG: hypothetical protein HYX61_00555 [Gammaproteobacteria bacterium]|jgi:hypothetical protein|nr:hypothetical protein [Gammaproteobacteria bacterium]
MKKVIINTLVLVTFICGVFQVVAEENKSEQDPTQQNSTAHSVSSPQTETSTSLPVNQNISNSTDEIEDMD